jgi:hypothetical protein
MIDCAEGGSAESHHKLRRDAVKRGSTCPTTETAISANPAKNRPPHGLLTDTRIHIPGERMWELWASVGRREGRTPARAWHGVNALIDGLPVSR